MAELRDTFARDSTRVFKLPQPLFHAGQTLFRLAEASLALLTAICSL